MLLEWLQTISTYALLLPILAMFTILLVFPFRKPKLSKGELIQQAQAEEARKAEEQKIARRNSPDDKVAQLQKIQDELESALAKAVEIDRPMLALLLVDALEEAKHQNDSLPLSERTK